MLLVMCHAHVMPSHPCQWSVQVMQSVACIDNEVLLEEDVLVGAANRTWHLDAVVLDPILVRDLPRRLLRKAMVEQLLQRRRTLGQPEAEVGATSRPACGT